MTTLVRAELTKTLTTRLWWGLLVGVVLYAALQAGLTAAVAGLETGPGQPATPPLDTPETVRSVYATAAFSGSYLFALVLGVTSMTGEYRYQTVTPTFLATPRRERVVAAKALAQLGVGAGYGVAATLVALLAGGIVMVVRGAGLGYGTEGLWRAVGLGVLAVGLWTLIGLGLGTLLRNQVAAIIVALGLGLLIEPIVSLVLVGLDQDGLAKYLPGNASSAMTSPPDTLLDLLPWWAGGLVMLGYALLFAAVGVALSLRRDVT